MVRESSGTAVIGGYIGEFHPGDVFLVGSNVPHVFKNEITYYEETSGLMADVIYVFIDEKLSRNELLNFSEIAKLFQLARQGIQLRGRIQQMVASQVEGLLSQNVFERQMSVVGLIYQISNSEEYVKLNGEINPKLIDETEGRRLNEVMQYTFDNFSERITLEEVA